MATVDLRFSALSSHVRTARLVATAMARRSGLGDDALDGVRLAVGEACTRAVARHQTHCPGEPVEVSFSDDDGSIVIVVTDRAPAYRTRPDVRAADPEPAGDAEMDPLLRRLADELAAGSALDEAAAGALPLLGLEVIRAVADRVEVVTRPGGTSVSMSWPLAAAAQA